LCKNESERLKGSASLEKSVSFLWPTKGMNFGYNYHETVDDEIESYLVSQSITILGVCSEDTILKQMSWMFVF